MRPLGILLLLASVSFANGILVDQGTPVRLCEHRVTATVKDRVAGVIVEQVFRNEGDRQLEGTYLFPLPRGAAVDGFAMTMGDRLVEGQVVDADDARAIYNAIVRKRRDPGLLEYVGRSLFQARVFPILPKSEIRIRLTYRQVLPEDAGRIEFRYPLGTDPLNGAAVDSILVDVRFESTVDLKSVFSPTHRVGVTRPDARSARVVYEAGRRRESRELVVHFGRSEEDVGFSLLSTKPADRDGTFLAVLAPGLKLDAEDIAPKDVVYLIDTSGSMRGEKLAEAKRALRTGVELLRDGDRFDVVGFSDVAVAFKGEMVPKTPATSRDANAWIDALLAGGGTALDDALTYALSLPGEEGRLRQVVLITDGRPTIGVREPDVILANAKKANRAQARVFTFGVGHDLDVGLLDRIAEATNGAREYVEPHESIDAVTTRFFRLTEQPVLTDVRLETGGGIAQVYPRRMPDLFVGGQVVLLGRYAKAGVRKLTLRGMHRGKPVAYEYDADLAAGDAEPYLERMWAQRKVAFLLDEIRLHGADPELVDEVKRLATLHGIVTPYTAGLVVAPGERPASSRPLRFTSGGGLGGSFRGPSGGVPPGLRSPSDQNTPPRPPSDAGSPGAATGPTTPSGPTTRPVKRSITTSKDLKRRKEEARITPESYVRSVEGKTFRWTTKKRWVDSAWDGEEETTKVEAFSDEYFELLEKDDRIARYLALGEHVVFVHEGTVYEVTP